eukprot:COSAG01_NODE_5720_length_4076_cov_49.466181_3_plen_42_part_00
MLTPRRVAAVLSPSAGPVQSLMDLRANWRRQATLVQERAHC